MGQKDFRDGLSNVARLEVSKTHLGRYEDPTDSYDHTCNVRKKRTEMVNVIIPH